MSSETATADAAPLSPPTAGVEETWTSFAAWAGDELGVRVVAADAGYRLEPDGYETANEDASASAVRRSWLRRRRKPDAPAQPLFTANTAREAVDELLRRLGQHDTPAFGRPADQPEAVHDLTDRLFAAYELGGGKVHLAGFHLEDRPFVRLTTRVGGSDAKPKLRHRYFTERGEPIAEDFAAALGLDRVASGVDPWPKRGVQQLDQAIAAARDGAAGEAVASIVWAKHASGRLRFEFGDASVDTTFDGWARMLQPPLVRCPETGRETRSLAVTHDGRIAAAEAIAACEATGRRHLREELETCTVSGGLVEPELVVRCDATDKPVLRDRTARCKRCGLRVASNAVTPSGCVGCDNAERAPAGDARMTAILAKHPRLAKRRWSLAETPRAYVLETAGWFRRRCVTLDRETLEIVHRAEAPRFSSGWRVVS